VKALKASNGPAPAATSSDRPKSATSNFENSTNLKRSEERRGMDSLRIPVSKANDVA